MSGTTINSNRTTPTPSTPVDQAAAPSSSPSIPVANQEFGYSADSGFEASTSGTGPGGVEYDASVSGPSISVDGDASASVGTDGIDVNVTVDVNATLAEAGAHGEKTFQVEVGGETLDITVDLSAEGV